MQSPPPSQPLPPRTDIPPVKKKKKSRIFDTVTIIVLVGLVVLVTSKGEQIKWFMQLRQWDKSGPTSVVEGFLDAAKAGKPGPMNSAVVSKKYKPITENGRIVRYEFPIPPGNIGRIAVADLVPPGKPAAQIDEYVPFGDGCVMVVAPGRTGKPVKYRVVLAGGDWKIEELGFH